MPYPTIILRTASHPPVLHLLLLTPSICHDLLLISPGHGLPRPDQNEARLANTSTDDLGIYKATTWYLREPGLIPLLKLSGCNLLGLLLAPRVTILMAHVASSAVGCARSCTDSRGEGRDETWRS